MKRKISNKKHFGIFCDYEEGERQEDCTLAESVGQAENNMPSYMQLDGAYFIKPVPVERCEFCK